MESQTSYSEARSAATWATEALCTPWLENKQPRPRLISDRVQTNNYFKIYLCWFQILYNGLIFLFDSFSNIFFTAPNSRKYQEISENVHGESFQSDKEQKNYEKETRKSLVSFKRGNEYKVGGVLLTIQHAMGVLQYMFYLSEKVLHSDIVEVNVCSKEQGQKYKIEKLSYNRKSYEQMPSEEKEVQIGIVTVSNFIKI